MTRRGNHLLTLRRALDQYARALGDLIAVCVLAVAPWLVEWASPNHPIPPASFGVLGIALGIPTAILASRWHWPKLGVLYALVTGPILAFALTAAVSIAASATFLAWNAAMLMLGTAIRDWPRGARR